VELVTHREDHPRELRHRRFRLRVLAGPDAGASATAPGRELSVGTAPANHLVLTDAMVSRHHLVVRCTERGYWASDVGSTNGTVIGDHVVTGALLRHGSQVTIGATVLAFEILDEEVSEPLSLDERWCSILGESPAMRRLFAVLPRIAASDATVLLEGETGTGKSIIARAIHDASARSGGPFITVDCSSIPPTLIEAVLFGHERGAFTGAHAMRVGAFEAAAGGTIFLDEIGELPLDMQPKLLRALETRTVQRLGNLAMVPLDLRVIAATNRDLREMVNRGAYRADLYYRLKVVTLEIPPLRERREDIPKLVAHFYQQLTGAADPPADLLCILAAMDWPGNVRELRNAVERAVVLGDIVPARRDADVSTPAFDPSIPFREAKRRANRRWERWYVTTLLNHTNGNLSEAARVARTDRTYLRKLLRRSTSELGGLADDDLAVDELVGG
jgi:DNA-binding NtrC family response regulator